MSIYQQVEAMMNDLRRQQDPANKRTIDLLRTILGEVSRQRDPSDRSDVVMIKILTKMEKNTMDIMQLRSSVDDVNDLDTIRQFLPQVVGVQLLQAIYTEHKPANMRDYIAHVNNYAKEINHRVDFSLVKEVFDKLNGVQ